MNRLIWMAAAAFAWQIPATSFAITCNHPAGGIALARYGDLNGSGVVNVADTVCHVVVALAVQGGSPPSSVACVAQPDAGADLNCDGTPTISDVLVSVRLALGQGVPAALSPDGDGCPSACATCSGGAGSCLIGGACVEEGYRAGTDGCQVCQPANNAWGWTTEAAQTWYLDTDADDYGVSGNTNLACIAVGSYSALVGGDCADDDDETYPDAPEICGDSIDNDCDSSVDENCAPTLANCSELLLGGYTTSGIYLIDPDGAGGDPPFEAYCKMDVGPGGWTLAMNLDTSDGHVMWWANSLWTNGNAHGDVSTPFVGDLVSPAWATLDGGKQILLVVHEQGTVVGWKRFRKADGSTMLQHLSGGDNTLIGTAVLDASTASIWTGENLVRTSTTLYANHCVQTGGSCTSGSAGSPDGDRIGSHQATLGDNAGGGLGNWHDMNYCCAGPNYGSGKVCNGSAIRTASEAQAGWCPGYGSGMNLGHFGADTFAPASCALNDSTCGNAAWSGPSGRNYDYAIYIGHLGGLGSDSANAAASCLAILNGGGSEGDGLYWLDPLNTGAFQAYCDMTYDGGGWTRIYHQDTSGGVYWTQGATQVNKPNPMAAQYAILNHLESFRRAGSFEFAMRWPASSTWTSPQHWRQTNNPVTDASGALTTGYQAINVSYTANGWGGLQKSAGQTESLLDGTQSPLNNWYYAVGTTYCWGGPAACMPAPNGGENVAELWVR